MKQTKRILSLLLSLCLVLGLIPGTAFAAGGNLPFTDVDTTDWCYDAVQYVYEKGMMNGTSATTFSPDGTTTRGMIVTILHRIEGTPAATGTAFTDVPTGQWYSDAVSWASANGIVGGYGNGRFGPSDPITREQMAAILNRYSTYKGYDAGTVGSITGFSDASQVSSYAAEPMGWAIGNGLISGVGNNTLAPKGNATRAQVATILMRFCENIADKANTTPTPEVPGTTVDKTYTVTFDLNYGSDTRYDTKTVKEGETVSKPSNPSRSGYSFGGWYAEKTGGRQFDFKTGITSDLTLYAHWSSNSSSGGGGGGGSYVPPSTTYYTVTFDANGGTASNSSLRIASGSAIGTLPTATRDGHTFLGWFTAAVGGTLITTSTQVTSNMTVYAQWNTTEIGGGNFRITFDTNDGRTDSIFQVQNLDAGDTVAEPTEEPTRELYRFTGWYLEPATVTEYDFSTPIVSNLTLYAGWGNPDGSDEELYAASNETETIYSITGIDVVDNEVIVTYNTNSQCLMAVEFFEDQMTGSDWSEAAQLANLSTTPISTTSGYTSTYGEMITLALPIEGTLPEHFVVRATLYGTGEAKDPTYVTNQYTATYETFMDQTVDSVTEEYGEDLVINFDNDRTTNFGVLKDSVKVITTASLVNGFEVTDVDIPDEVVPDHHFIFANADEQIQNLQVGDVVYLEGTTWLFKIATKSNDGGTVTLTQDKDTTLDDFYDVLQVDMVAETANAETVNAESDIAPQWEVIDVDANGSVTIGPFSVSNKFSNGVELSGSISGKVSGNVKVSYDAHLFSKDYIEASVSFTTELTGKIEAKVSTGSNTDNNHEWKNVVFQVDTRKVRLPTPVTGLDIYIKPSAQIDWSLSGDVSINWTSKQTSGFKYNSDTGRTDIKKKENTVSLMAKGSATVKVGPILDIGIELLGGVLSGSVVAEAGAKFTATAETGADDFTNTVDSKHACGLCVTGRADWYASAFAKCSYKITNHFKGDIVKVQILDFTAPITFNVIPGKFFVSIINSMDSPFEGKIKFGGGDCTNKTYRTEFQVMDENDQQVTGTEVRVIKQGQTSSKSGTSPYVVYLYSGTYNASASLNGSNVSKMFVVGTSRQIVPLTLLSADSVLEGTIVDANDHTVAIEGASIKVSKDDVVIASAESDSSGKFSVAVPDGALKVDISKDGYLAFTSTETVYEGEKHSMGLVELMQGAGEGGFHGVIRDATNNNPIPDVTLSLYKGWNNPAEPGTYLKKWTTNSNGEFRYDTVTLFGKVHGLPSGNYTLTASKDGYSDTSYNIVVYPGTTDENPAINETMSPAMNDGYYRIVLTWGATPSDLDSHLVADTDTGSDIHVYFGDMDPSPNYANLDVDDTSSYGPETTTVTNFDGLSSIRYAVHDYTNRGSTSSTALSYSNAVVRLFKGSQLLRTFQVPTGYGGTEWDMFELDSNGRITTINTMTYADDPLDVLSNGISAHSDREPAPLKDYELFGGSVELPIPSEDGDNGNSPTEIADTSNSAETEMPVAGETNVPEHIDNENSVVEGGFGNEIPSTEAENADIVFQNAAA